MAVISVPGEYAAAEAHKAQGDDVLLFSDNVSLEDEVTLALRARASAVCRGAPGAGTGDLVDGSCVCLVNVGRPWPRPGWPPPRGRAPRRSRSCGPCQCGGISRYGTSAGETPRGGRLLIRRSTLRVAWPRTTGPTWISCASRKLPRPQWVWLTVLRARCVDARGGLHGSAGVDLVEGALLALTLGEAALAAVRLVGRPAEPPATRAPTGSRGRGARLFSGVRSEASAILAERLGRELNAPAGGARRLEGAGGSRLLDLGEEEFTAAGPTR